MPRPDRLIRSTRTRTARVYSIAVQTDGKIVAGGQFHSIGGATRNFIARLDATTGLADSFDPNGNGRAESGVYAIVVQADGKILACGRFGTIGGQTRNNIARLDAVTGLADSWNPNAAVGLKASIPWRCRRMGRLWWARRLHHRRTDAQLHRPSRWRDRLG